jgi:hypothetical protein
MMNTAQKTTIVVIVMTMVGACVDHSITGLTAVNLDGLELFATTLFLTIKQDVMDVEVMEVVLKRCWY